MCSCARAAAQTVCIKSGDRTSIITVSESYTDATKCWTADGNACVASGATSAAQSTLAAMVNGLGITVGAGNQADPASGAPFACFCAHSL